jgi:hypothetical protein
MDFLETKTTLIIAKQKKKVFVRFADVEVLYRIALI